MLISDFIKLITSIKKKEFTPAEIWLLMCFIEQMELTHKDYAEGSAKTWAVKTTLSERTVQRLIKNLRDADIIEVTNTLGHQGTNGANQYKLLVK